MGKDDLRVISPIPVLKYCQLSHATTVIHTSDKGSNQPLLLVVSPPFKEYKKSFITRTFLPLCKERVRTRLFNTKKSIVVHVYK